MNDLLTRIKDKISKQDNFRIVLYGDSITSAEWIHPNWREMVEYVLKDYLMGKFSDEDWWFPLWKIRCINAGFDGATSKDLLDMFDVEVLSYKPDLVICMFGKNDRHFEISPSEQRKNIKLLLDRLSKVIDDVFYCTNFPALDHGSNTRYESYVKEVKELFPVKGVQFLNLFSEAQDLDLAKFFTLRNKYGISAVGIKPGEVDPVHPNHLGNAYIAKLILEKVFGINFNPEVYLKEALSGDIMFPNY